MNGTVVIQILKEKDYSYPQILCVENKTYVGKHILLIFPLMILSFIQTIVSHPHDHAVNCTPP